MAFYKTSLHAKKGKCCVVDRFFRRRYIRGWHHGGS